ncbi:class I SAM-dependent methyltransferase [Nocardioides coralli]|uniref:class I SAM-dependent methyltransferase n=1 Tax=Nocardioides coralli TaxID=2872154 RepID=UPI001CA46554|nr:class I SAM-dependent methyltransferase [Nocardioides coralli]QZY27903.1 class I SAM-dependent methyltransferase [Nocardioides coralli]
MLVRGRPAGGRRTATLRRSIRLLREFRHEQTDPERFYRAVADDSVAQLAAWTDLDGARLLDVGGGPGYFRDAFRAAGADYVALDADVGELSGAGDIPPGTVIGSGMQLPFRDASVDVCYSSNVLEHVPDPWRMAEEMVRVTRPGGLVYLSYTVWFGPWGGHETAPWHYLGGRRARRQYVRRHGHEPKNRYGETMFGVTVAEGLGWARGQRLGDVVAVLPRYNPWWSHWLLRVPLLREVVTWNLVLVLRRT